MKTHAVSDVYVSGLLSRVLGSVPGRLCGAMILGALFAVSGAQAQPSGSGPNTGGSPPSGTAIGGSSGGAGAAVASNGERKSSMCIGCHGIPGYQASFPEVYHVPKIAGQNAGYIRSALAQYRKGDRKHPTMRAIAGSLTDQDIADLADYYANEAKADPAPPTPGTIPADVAAVLQKGNCTSCHGANFSKPIDPTYPKLAGQHKDYLYIALREYQTDKNPQVGRNNAIMSGMARVLSHDDAKLLAGYIASLPTELKTVAQSRWR